LFAAGGANSSTGAAGYGITAVGGAASGVGAAGHGVVGTGGASTSGTDGYGGLFTAGGTQTIGCAIPNTNDFGYTSARTYYKWITAEQMAIGVGNYSVADNSSTGYVYNSAGVDIQVAARVDIPASATVTAVGVSVWNDDGADRDFEIFIRAFSESAGSISESGAVTDTQTITVGDMSTSPANGVIQGGLTPTSVVTPTGQSSTGVQGYTVGVNSTAGTTGNKIRLYGIRITYTMTALNPNA
jgi:hypothetical protein